MLSWIRRLNGFEVNLMAKYPRANRDLTARKKSKTEADQLIARKFDRDFFDGDRRHGYGGLTYDPKYWSGVAQDF